MPKSGGLLAVFFCLVAAPLAALVSPVGIHPEGVRILPLEVPLALTGDLSASAAYEAGPEWTAFLEREGGEWYARYDRRTGLPTMAWGSGIPWIPGRGNDLAPPQGYSAYDPLRTLQRKALEFMAENRGLFPVAPSDLTLNPRRSVSLDGGLYHQVEFAYTPGGLKVPGAYVFFRVGHGNLVQFGTRHILPEPPVSPDPAVTADAAFATALAHLGAKPGGLEVRDPGSLYFLPQAEGEGLTYRLVWQTTFIRPGQVPTWTAVVDAHTGELVAFFDANCYACDPALLAQGRVDGGVRPIWVTDDEVVRALPFTNVDTPGGTETTDFNGIYPYNGGLSTCTLGGAFARIDCRGCNNPPDPYLENATTGDFHFGTGGVNQNGNGTSTPADRTCFYHVNLVRSLAAKWVPVIPFLTDNLRVNTNRWGSCNAWFDGASINFLRSGGGCTNTGENPGVIQHEWGHALHIYGLDWDGSLSPTPGFDGSYSEGLADHMSWLITHDPRVGAGFRTDGSPVRNVDEDQDPAGLRTLTNNPGCPGGSGYDGYEVHCGGLIYGQAGWQLRNLLGAKYGEAAGWFMYERLTFAGVPLNETHVPMQAHSVYDGYAFLMDDDGDLVNGVPDAQELNDAFNRHGIASVPNVVVSATNLCDPAPVAPVLTALPVLDPAVNQYQVQLSWTPVPGANFYDLYRSDDGPDHAFLAIAQNIDGAQDSFVDDTVRNLMSYDYRLVVVDTNGCVSVNDNLETAVVDLAEITLEVVVVNDDSGNGVLIPGEAADLPLELRNLGGGDATGVSADLSAASSGVTVLTTTAAYPDIPGGTLMAPSGAAFRIQLDPDTNLCSGTVELYLSVESDQGCWDDSFSILVGGGMTSVAFDSAAVLDGAAGNASGTLDPGETADLSVRLDNLGPGDSAATRATLIPLDPRITVLTGTADYGDIASGATGGPAAPFQVRLDPAHGCGEVIPFELLIESDAGCWRDTFNLSAGLYEVFLSDDMETDTGWSVGAPTDTAWVGIWERADPQATNGGAWQPGNDHTPGAGRECWVTGAAAGAQPGNFDVDGGCTTLFSPVWDLGDTTGAQLSYWRWYLNETELDDDFLVEISNNGGTDWQELERVPVTTTPWRRAAFDLETELGAPDQVQLKFVACDEGGGSLTEALVDDLLVDRWVCDPPEPRSELVVDSWAARDNLPGLGNDDGILDPGETVEIALDLRNVRNAEAVNVAVSIAPSPGGGFLVEPLATAPNVPGGQTVTTNAPHLQFQIDEYYPNCFGSVSLDVTVTYEDTIGSRVAFAVVDLTVGSLGAPVTVFADDFEDADDNGWTHAPTRGNDSWERGAPQAMAGDADAAVSGTNVWGNDLSSDGEYFGGSTCHLESPALDLTDMGGAEVRFQRWLTVEEGIYDQARVLVNGEVVWVNRSNGHHQDTAWTAQQIDVSAITTDQPAVSVRFELASDQGLHMGGWNLDDFEVRASPMECTPLCSGPPPSTGNTLRVLRSGRDVVLDWSGMADRAWFNVYRADDAAQVPPAGAASPVRTVREGTSSNEGDAAALPSLTFFRILSLNPCGQEE